MSFIGRTEIEVDEVQLDAIINGLDLYKMYLIDAALQYTPEATRVDDLREYMKEVQLRCETPIF
jgi:hypothetical protein